MLRAPRSMPNSSGGTPITLAWASFRVVTMVTSCVTGASGGASKEAAGCTGADTRGTLMFISWLPPRLRSALPAYATVCATIFIAPPDSITACANSANWSSVRS